MGIFRPCKPRDRLFALAKHQPALIVGMVLAENDLAALARENDTDGHKAGRGARAFRSLHGHLDHLAARSLRNVCVPHGHALSELACALLRDIWVEGLGVFTACSP